MEKYTLVNTAILSKDNKEHYLIFDKPLDKGKFLLEGDSLHNASLCISVESSSEKLESKDSLTDTEYITKVNVPLLSTVGIKRITIRRGSTFLLLSE